MWEAKDKNKIQQKNQQSWSSKRIENNKKIEMLIVSLIRLLNEEMKHK